MLRLLRTRRWLGFTALVLFAIVAFGLLSRWQWSRADEKRAERVAISAASDARPVEVGTPAAEWTAVEASGEYGAQAAVRQRPLDGRNGYWVLALLRIDDGHAVWVNRGWLAATGPATVSPELPPTPTGTVHVTGWWRPFETTDVRTGLPAGIVAAVDPDVLPQAADVRGWIQLDASDPRESELIPVPRPEIDEGRNISYAMQWLLFAAVAIVGWWFFLRREAIEDGRRAPADE